MIFRKLWVGKNPQAVDKCAFFIIIKMTLLCSSVRKNACMSLGGLRAMVNDVSEMVIQKFDQRCPYCDQPVSYEKFDLKKGENRIICPSCGETYIKVVQE